MKKLLFSLMTLVALVTVAGFASFAENKADIEASKANSSYVATTTTTGGWLIKNAAFVSIDNVFAPTLNGKTSAVGSITSPTLKDGLSQISFKYTNTFSETKGVSLRIDVKQNGAVVDSETLTNTSVTTKTIYTFESKAFDVEGDFQIVITNLSPSNSSSNKDRVSIWNLTWTNYSNASDLLPAEMSFAETNLTVTLGEEFTAPELTKATTAEAVYSSSNPEVATVDAATGAVTLVGAGETTITATCAENDEYAAGEVSYALTVLSNLKEAELSFPEKEYTVTLGETFTAPELTKVTTAEAVYTSSNTEVATVDAVTGAVTVVGVGETTITATCAENDEYLEGKAEYTLTVLSNLKEAGLKFSAETVTVIIGKEFTAPDLNKATTADVVYTSSNPEVATVDAATGAVTLVGTGETIITAKCEANEEYQAGEASYTLIVESTEIAVHNVKLYGTDNWASISNYTSTLTSKDGLWTLQNFNNNNNSSSWSFAKTGNKTAASVGVFASVKAIEEPVTKVVVNISAITTSSVNSIKLYVADNADFTNATVISSTNALGTGALPFVIEKPAADMYYKVEFDCQKGSTNGLISVSSVAFFTEDGLEVKAPAGLSFPEAAYTVKLGEEFTAPEPAKTTTAEAVYSSSNEEVATVDAATGAVTLVGVGETTITATTAETDAFLAGKAQYTLTVLSNLKEAALSFSEAEYTVSLGEEFTAPVLTKITTADAVYSSSNEEVATVDSATGAVTILSAGETVITATCAENEEYQAGTANYKLIVNEPLNENEVEEVLTITSFGSPLSYSDVSYTSPTTGIVYKGQMTTNNGNMQMRSSNENSGIVVNENKNGYKVKSIEVVYASNTSSGRTLDVYGKDSNYTAATDLYNSNTAGTKEGSIEYEKEKPVNFATPMLYWGVRSNNNALYVEKITIIYEKPQGVILQEPALEFPEASYNATIGEAFVAPELTKATTADAVYTSSNEAVATVDAATGEVTLVAFGTTVITATCEENDEYRAGSASYTLTVTDPAIKVIYDQDLKSDASEFTFVTNEGDINPWAFDSSYGMKASAYKSGNNVSDATAISPVIDLTSYIAPISATFQQAGSFFGGTNNSTPSTISDFCSVMVREADASEFTDKMECAMPTVNGYVWINSDVDLSAYAGKKIQLGFRYTSTTAVAGTWEIKDLLIQGKYEAANGVEGVEVEGTETVYYTLQGQRVVNPDKGVYIRVCGGKADKVMF